MGQKFCSVREKQSYSVWHTTLGSLEIPPHLHTAPGFENNRVAGARRSPRHPASQPPPGPTGRFWKHSLKTSPQAQGMECGAEDGRRPPTLALGSLSFPGLSCHRRSEQTAALGTVPGAGLGSSHPLRTCGERARAPTVAPPSRMLWLPGAGFPHRGAVELGADHSALRGFPVHRRRLSSAPLASPCRPVASPSLQR